MYGCSEPGVAESEPGHVAGGDHPVILPNVTTLFDECDWQEFVSFNHPYSNTWDIEMRAEVIRKRKKRRGHVCGSQIYDAMYIDARTINDDTPADETGEMITKYTPQ